jgi:uncharacterized protein (TIGR02118 family)
VRATIYCAVTPSMQSSPALVLSIPRSAQSSDKSSQGTVMAKLIALYKQPADAAAFDRHYTTTHIPLAKKVAGLRRYEISSGPVDTPGGESPLRLVAILTFDSKQAIIDGLGTPEGQAAVDDLGKFAQAGVDVLIFDSKEV